MTTTTSPTTVGTPHRLLAFARAVEDALDRVSATPAWSMTPAEQAETLLTLDRVRNRLAEIDARVLVAADRNGVGGEEGATSTAAWLARRTRATRAGCARRVRFATALDEGYPATGAALRAGRVNPAQAQVIVVAVDALTHEHDDLPPDARQRAEAHLLDLADRFDARDLHRLGKKLFEVLCPEAADQAEADRLAQEEDRARRLTHLTLRDNGDGTVDGRFRIPTLHAAVLRRALEALTSPRRLGEGRLDPATGKKLPYSTLLGRGFCDLLENHLTIGTLPTQQKSPFTLVVTLSLHTLTSGLGSATLETGEPLSPGTARRLACKAGIIPMVLGGDSVPLDLGREQRLHDRYQRIALAHQHGGCAATGCDRPASWVEIHHPHPWAHGGRTDLANGLPLCPPHHHMADHPQAWRMTRMPDGAARFARRQ